MKVETHIEGTLSVSEAKTIIEKALMNEGYKGVSVNFVVEGKEDPTDYRAEFPLTYEVTEISFVARSFEPSS